MHKAKHLLIGIMLVVLATGCATPQPQPSVGTPPAPSVAPAARASVEEATKTVVSDYFSALVAKDYTKANNLTTGSLHVTNPASLGQNVEFQEATITQLQYDGTKTVDGKVAAYLEVHIQTKFAPNKQGAWGDGPNTRFAQLLQENGEWKLAVLATSPPDLTGVTK